MPETIGTISSNFSVADPNNQIASKADITGTAANIQFEQAIKMEKFIDPVKSEQFDLPHHLVTESNKDTFERGLQMVIRNHYEDLI